MIPVLYSRSFIDVALAHKSLYHSYPFSSIFIHFYILYSAWLPGLLASWLPRFNSTNGENRDQQVDMAESQCWWLGLAEGCTPQALAESNPSQGICCIKWDIQCNYQWWIRFSLALQTVCPDPPWLQVGLSGQTGVLTMYSLLDYLSLHEATSTQMSFMLVGQLLEFEIQWGLVASCITSHPCPVDDGNLVLSRVSPVWSSRDQPCD